MPNCECSDPGCPIHPGKTECSETDDIVTVFRSDMEDETGTEMCSGCASDALESGVFYTEDEDDPNDCAECARSYGPHYLGPCEHE
jgi:hypothetical protein